MDLCCVVQIGIFKDHFNLRLRSVNGLSQSHKLIVYILPVSAACLADVDDHIEFLTAIPERLVRLGQLDGGGVAAMRKANGGAGVYGASGQLLSATRESKGHDAHAGDVVAERQG